MRLAVVDVGAAVSGSDLAHDGRMRLVNGHIGNLDVRRWLKLLECIEKVALSRVRHELPRKLALFRHAEYDRSAILVQECTQRLAGIAALSSRFLRLLRLALVVCNLPFLFFRCHLLLLLPDSCFRRRRQNTLYTSI